MPCFDLLDFFKNSHIAKSPDFPKKIRTFGGDGRDRTVDLLNAIQALSQLSYAPVWYLKIITQVVTNFKPFFVFLLIFFRKAKNIAVYSML